MPPAGGTAPILWRQEGRQIAPPLVLSSLSLNLLVGLAQRSTGTSASELARIVAGPTTSVHSALRALSEHGLVQRNGTRYVLVRTHPAAAEAVALGLRIADPAEVMRIVLRANDAVAFACADELGFIVGMHAIHGGRGTDALDEALDAVRRDRPDAPVVLRFAMDELARIVHSAVALRRRIGAADVVKGSVTRVGPSAPARSPGSPIATARIPSTEWDH